MFRALGSNPVQDWPVPARKYRSRALQLPLKSTYLSCKYGVPSSCPLQPLRRHLPTELDPITGAILIGTLILHATTAYLDINPSDDVFLIPHAPTTTRSVCSALLLRPHTSISASHLLVSLSSRRATLYVPVPPESVTCQPVSHNPELQSPDPRRAPRLKLAFALWPPASLPTSSSPTFRGHLPPRGRRGPTLEPSCPLG